MRLITPGAPKPGRNPSTVDSGAIGSLVLGYFDRDTLIYAGRVGTGFSNKVAADLFRRLVSLINVGISADKLALPEWLRLGEENDKGREVAAE